MDKSVSLTSLFLKITDAAARRVPFLFFVNYELDEGYMIENPIDEQNVLWRVGRHTNFAGTQPPVSPGRSFTPCPITPDRYHEKFATIRRALTRGDTFLANLTVQTPVETDFSLEEIFARSHSRYGLLVPDRFVCFSPETFVRINGNTIRSYPMKGTISGAIPDAERVILSDYKETCEHNTIVDFIRSDLARVGTNVRVPRFRYIDRLQTSKGEVLQVSSEVSAELSEDWRLHLGDILRELLPAGSICGAPRSATLRAIATAEGEPRGFYTGIMGYYDGFDFDSAVLIRYIEQLPNGCKAFRSGGGITINSNEEEEYNEVLQKVYLPF